MEVWLRIVVNLIKGAHKSSLLTDKRDPDISLHKYKKMCLGSTHFSKYVLFTKGFKK